MYQRINADRNMPGFFWLQAPIGGTVLTADFRENLPNRYVRPQEQLLRIGNKEGAWEVELKIPQKHIGQVLRAYQTTDPNEELEVDLLPLSAPTHVFKGKLARYKISGEASPSKTDNDETEPVVLAWVRIDGKDIPEADNLYRFENGRLLVTGTEMHTRVRCGSHAMGYSLFYGVWEWFYEKVVFFF
jgi:hypothetical protein